MSPLLAPFAFCDSGCLLALLGTLLGCHAKVHHFAAEALKEFDCVNRAPRVGSPF